MRRFVVSTIAALVLAACSANDRSYLLTYDQVKSARDKKVAHATDATPAAPPVAVATARPPATPVNDPVPRETVVQPAPPAAAPPAAAPPVVATTAPVVLAAPAYHPPVRQAVPTETVVTPEPVPPTIAAATSVPRETVVTPVRDDVSPPEPAAVAVSMRAISPAKEAKEAKCRQVGDQRARDAANNGYAANLQAVIRDKAVQDCLRFTPDSN